MQRHITKLTHQLTEVKTQGIGRKSGHRFITSLENPFQKHVHRKQLLDRDECHEDFSTPIYSKIHVNCYSPLIYDVYFKDDYLDDGYKQ
jgi:hypothetical protein